MPPHSTYVEPFLGGGAILRFKRPAALNIGIDLDGDAVEKFSSTLPPELASLEYRRIGRGAPVGIATNGVSGRPRQNQRGSQVVATSTIARNGDSGDRRHRRFRRTCSDPDASPDRAILPAEPPVTAMRDRGSLEVNWK